ncbi:MAG: TIGR03862 family flavoprotein [Flavobacteriia bacterium]|nr:TIGR03862 family flavoprotein [Flavobacteriia bacterium]
MSTKIVHIIGTGPAALMAGTQLAEKGIKIHFYDQKTTPARKFLVAGNGGFNLTHSESLSEFIKKYNRSEIQKAVEQFTNIDFVQFLKKIGIETFTGSSGKIFPKKGIKPIQVIQAWIRYLKNHNAEFHFQYRFIDFNEVTFCVKVEESKKVIPYERLIFALGGASWKKTGSTGEWLSLFKRKGIQCSEFEPSNSGFEISNWEINAKYEGEVFKNCVVSINGVSKLGEIVLTKYGLEGSPIYFLNKAYRINQKSLLHLDFKATKTVDEIKLILQKSKNHSEGLKNLNLSKFVQAFLKNNTSKEIFSSIDALATIIKEFPLTIQSLRPIDEVISTIGGISMDAINSQFQLKQYPNISVCGEMLDWDAPTGGYLIQAAVSSGFIVGRSISKDLI